MPGDISKNYAVFDTSIGTDNVGDEIIMDAVWSALSDVLPQGRLVGRIATHRYMTPGDYRARHADLAIVGGTNILKSHLLVRCNWKLMPWDLLLWRDVVLLGVGWQQYMGAPDLFSRQFFRRVLSRRYLHSVRDGYTLDKLSRHIPNVINTACPTLWGMDAAACARIPTTKARKAIFAVTYYRPDPDTDRQILDLLKQQYEQVYFWPQQPRDCAYARETGLEGMTWIEPSLAAYDRVLSEEPVDFVGARLHGGIRALQHGRRSLILAVDNRAVELGRDCDLPVADRADLSEIRAWIGGSAAVRVTVPWEAVAQWKAQFSDLSA